MIRLSPLRGPKIAPGTFATAGSVGIASSIERFLFEAGFVDRIIRILRICPVDRNAIPDRSLLDQTQPGLGHAKTNTGGLGLQFCPHGRNPLLIFGRTHPSTTGTIWCYLNYTG